MPTQGTSSAASHGHRIVDITRKQHEQYMGGPCRSAWEQFVHKVDEIDSLVTTSKEDENGDKKPMNLGYVDWHERLCRSTWVHFGPTHTQLRSRVI